MLCLRTYYAITRSKLKQEGEKPLATAIPADPVVQKQVATKMGNPQSKSDCYQRCYQRGFPEGGLGNKLFVLWCARHDSNMRPSGS